MIEEKHYTIKEKTLDNKSENIRQYTKIKHYLIIFLYVKESLPHQHTHLRIE